MYTMPAGPIARKIFYFGSEVIAAQPLKCDFNFLLKSPPQWFSRDDFTKSRAATPCSSRTCEETKKSGRFFAFCVNLDKLEKKKNQNRKPRQLFD
jgi:hypothetical protein